MLPAPSVSLLATDDRCAVDSALIWTLAVASVVLVWAPIAVDLRAEYRALGHPALGHPDLERSDLSPETSRRRQRIARHATDVLQAPEDASPEHTSNLGSSPDQPRPGQRSRRVMPPADSWPSSTSAGGHHLNGESTCR